MILAALFPNRSNFFLFVSGIDKNAVLQYVVTGCTIALYRSRAACIVSMGRMRLSSPSLLDVFFCKLYEHGQSVTAMDPDGHPSIYTYQYCLWV